MTVSFGETISASIEWTKTVLFRPFSLKKCFFLFLITLLAFQLQGGCNNANFNIETPGPKTQEAEQVETSQPEIDPQVAMKAAINKAVDEKGKATLILIISILGFLALLLFLAIEWIYSVFSFVFIEAVVNNDASIRRPFTENKLLGNSYFAWNILYLLFLWGTLGLLAILSYNSLSRLGVFQEGNQVAFGQMAALIIPYIITAGFVISASLLLSFFISQYVLVVMYKDRVSVLKAIPRAFSLVTSNIGAFIGYIFVRMGLQIASAIIVSFIIFFMVFGLLVPIGLIVVILSLLLKVMPLFLRPFYITLLFITGIPFAIALAVLINAAFLPFPVFFKTLNLKFISRINERYNVFRSYR